MPYEMSRDFAHPLSFHVMLSADVFRSDLRPRHISTCPMCFQSTADAAAAHVAAVPAASVERVWRDALRYRADQQLLRVLEPRHGWYRGTSAPVRVPPGECTAAGRGASWNSYRMLAARHRPSGSDMPCSSISDDCSSYASTSAMAARLCRRPWTLWDTAFVFFEPLLRTLYSYDTINSAFWCIIVTSIFIWIS